MFSTPALSTPGRSNPFTNTYRQMDAETGVAAASPHRLVGMLYDGFMDAVAQARGALRDGDIATKSNAIGRAARIVDEGLRASLDLSSGGELASDLNALYTYVAHRLTLANLNNDEALLDECQRLIAPLRDAWLEIGSRVQGGQ